MIRLLSLFLLPLATLAAFAASLDAPAPAFSLKNLHQQTRTLNSYRGQIILIDFWASWCAPCLQELPELNRLAADYKGKRVRVVAINVDAHRADAARTLAKMGLTHPALDILWDTRSKAVNAYDIPAMPSSYLLDSHGIIRYAHSGFHSQDPAVWRQEINTLTKRLE